MTSFENNNLNQKRSSLNQLLQKKSNGAQQPVLKIPIQIEPQVVQNKPPSPLAVKTPDSVPVPPPSLASARDKARSFSSSFKTDNLDNSKLTEIMNKSKDKKSEGEISLSEGEYRSEGQSQDSEERESEERESKESEERDS
jgi:hypothetical protein